MSARRAPVHGPGTYNGAVLPAPHRIGREREPMAGVVIHEHGIAGAIIRTHRTYRTSPAGWVYQIRRGDWVEVGYTRRQSEALAVAVGRLCRAVDRGEVTETSSPGHGITRADLRAAGIGPTSRIERMTR